MDYVFSSKEMKARSFRGFSGQSGGWQGRGYDSNNYDPQYPDDNASDFVRLDHCRLYVTNIPKALNDEGLRAAFARYGTLTEVHVSRDPIKRYGLVCFETAAEARHAMMKLNQTDPLKLNIAIAHERKDSGRKESSQNRNRTVSHASESTSTLDQQRSARDPDNGTSTFSVRVRNSKVRPELAIGDNMVSVDNLPLELDDGLELGSLEPELQLELERLQLKELQLQEAQLAMKRKLLLKQAFVNQSSKTTVVDKKITRTIVDRSPEHRDGDSSFAAGAGDSACVVCGGAAPNFCGGCGVTPYCSQRCQRRDWHDRHKNVCHNLARLNEEADMNMNGATNVEITIPAPAPLRRPRSPVAREDKDDSSEKSSKKFVSPGGRNVGRGGDGARNINNRQDQNRQEDYNRQGDNNRQGQNDRFNRQGNRDGRPQNENRRPQNDNRRPQNDNRRPGGSGEDRRPFRRPESEADEDWSAKGVASPGLRRYDSRRVRVQVSVGDDCVEDWDAKLAAPKPKEPEQEVIRPKIQSPEQPPLAKIVRPISAKLAEKANQSEAKSANQRPGTVTDVTPIRKLVPKNCVVDTLSAGDSLLLSVESSGAECRAGSGWVCLSLHESREAEYQSLCEQYGAACEGDTQAYSPTPGDTFSYFNPEDSGWYRARCLTPTSAALLDAGRVVSLAPGARCRRLPADYKALPEFCCLLQANVETGANLTCTLLEKTPGGFKVSLTNAETGQAAGEGTVSRWAPAVEAPAPAVVAAGSPAAAAPVAIPEVPRPPVSNNSRVYLAHATDCSAAYVRPAAPAAAAAFEATLQDTAMYGQGAPTLKEPPTMGQYVVSKFTDGNHYRALVKRTNAKQKKYMVEYTEFGNTQINTLENLCPCPPHLQPAALPVLTSRVALHQVEQSALTPAHDSYIDRLKDDQVELVLTIPTGAATAPSGAEVILTVEKDKEVVNKKLQQMSTPEWVKLQEKGVDVVETPCIMYDSLEYTSLPEGPCTLQVLDFSSLAGGTLSGCKVGEPTLQYVLTTLTEKMGKYCESELGKAPYLPKAEELCIAQLPPYPQWFRAVLMEQVNGPGGSEAELCYVDYGNMERVSCSLLRKMLPEFVSGIPALANVLQIQDFPAHPSDEMLASAIDHLQLDDEGRGTLAVTRVEKEAPGMYVVHAPALLAAMRGEQ